MDAPDLFSNCLSTKYLDCGLLGAISWWEVSLTFVPPNNQNPMSCPRPSVSRGQATHSFWRCFKKSKKHLALNYQYMFNFLFNFKSIFVDHPFNFYPKTYRHIFWVIKNRCRWCISQLEEPFFLNLCWISEIISFWSESNSKNLGVSLLCFQIIPPLTSSIEATQRKCLACLTTLHKRLLHVNIFGFHFVQISAIGPLGYLKWTF